MKKTGWQAGLFGKKLEYLKKHNYFNVRGSLLRLLYIT